MSATAGMQRVEYPISGAYCADWGMVEALREIIANMLDAQAEHECTFSRGTASFIDNGSGFAASCLMFGEGEAKSGEQIGQFREGLKLALLTLARLDKRVSLETTEFALRSAKMEPTALGKDGLVLYIDNNEKRKAGTEIRVQCTQKEYDKAVDMFLGLLDDDYKDMEIYSVSISTGEGRNVVYPLRGAKKWGSIYVNGLLTDGRMRWLYNYDLRGQSIKSAMNRDRTVLSQHEVEREVFNIWSQCDRVDTIRQLIKITREHPTCSEASLFGGYHSPRAMHAWCAAVSEELGGLEFGKLVLDDGRPHMIRGCKELGYHPIFTEKQLGPMVAPWLNRTLVTATRRLQEIQASADKKAQRRNKTKDFGHYEVVAWKDIPEEAMQKLNQAAMVAREAYLASNGWGFHSNLENPEYFVYTMDHTGQESEGCAYENKVGIQYDYLVNVHNSIAEIAGTIMHEILHLDNPRNVDCTREFENAFTTFLGLISKALVDRIEEPVGLDVRYTPKSPKRLTSAGVSMNPDTLSIGDITQAVNQSLSTAAGDWAKDVSADWGSPKNTDRAQGLLWRYEGVVYDGCHRRQSASGTSTTSSYTFLARGKLPSQVYSLTITIADVKAARIKRRAIRIQWNWVSDRVRRFERNGEVSYKDSPITEAWPDMGTLMKEGIVPQVVAARTGSSDST